jgi:hypothetical protein
MGEFGSVQRTGRHLRLIERFAENRAGGAVVAKSDVQH